MFRLNELLNISLHIQIFPKGLDNSIQVKILRKTTNFLSLQNMFRENFCHLQLNDLQSKLNNK